MYGERSDESQKVGQGIEEEIKQQAEAEKKKEEQIAEEKTDTVGEVWDVVFSRVFSVQMFRDDAKKLATEIIRQVGDAEISISPYEWNFQHSKVYAKVEISRAVYSHISAKDILNGDVEIHAIDEINFSTMGARQRKKT